MQKKNIASLSLAASAGGFLATIPVAEMGFLGGMVHHGFLAATIGGLADWFAVTALFGKPLGISYRTDILRRNRPRIMEAIVDYAADDLLSTEHIMDAVRDMDMAQMMIDYFLHRDGTAKLEKTLDAVLIEVAASIDIPVAVARIAPLIRQEMARMPLEVNLLQFFQILAEDRYCHRFLRVLLDVAQRALHAPEVQDVLRANIAIVRRHYEDGASARSMIFDLFSITDEFLCEMLTSRIEAYLASAMTESEESHTALHNGFAALLRHWAESEELERILKEWKSRHIGDFDIEAPMTRWLERNLRTEHPAWLETIHQLLEQKIADFADQQSMQRRFDAFAKKIIEQELHEHHDALRGMIRSRLDEFSDDALVEFVETRIEDDIQMIRVNGAAVGSLVGMLLYAIVFLLEWGLGE